MEGSKPCVTPLSTAKLDHESPLLDNPEEYMSLVGGLQYLTWTRPDLSFAVHTKSKTITLSSSQAHPQISKRHIVPWFMVPKMF